MSDWVGFCCKEEWGGIALLVTSEKSSSVREAADTSVQHWGWACEKVVAIDVVTSTGEVLHCNKDQNSELLWAARGAGPGVLSYACTVGIEAHALL